MRIFKNISLILALLLLVAASNGKIINASFDSTREVFKEINQEFRRDYGQKVKILQSHTGSSKQARALIQGVTGHVVSLSSNYDMDMLANHLVIKKNWQDNFPNSSSPYGSVIVFVVRKDNPKNIKDWDDLLDNVAVITPNPKTSGAARWNYLAAWEYAMAKYHDEEEAFNFVKTIYRNVPIADTSARSAAVTFAKRNIGDVLITWENEAFAIINGHQGKDFAIISPSLSLLINLPVAISEKHTTKHQNHELATAYIDYLYSPKAQEIFAKHHFRPIDEKIIMAQPEKFVSVGKLINGVSLGDSASIQQKHFAAGGLFDRIY
jgi:sulfate/thiosulfate transport system substrate-binding protein